MKISGTLILLLLCLPVGAALAEPRSVFYPEEVVRRARANRQKLAWAGTVCDQVIAKARVWKELSDEHLWSLMFGNTIKRAWQVWSNGVCPACKQSVPMYDWQMDALHQPWKTRCPHCKELFPKNDFGRFYRSGLDEQGVFDPKRADRTLLFNTEHPDPNDPLHRFGVDDGEGYVEGAHRWRFIGAYLIFGQWKQAIVDGVRSLAAAYALTGESVYAHKAGVLLDRVADLYPTMDFGKEGVMYEGAPRSGYVSTWHDACEETRELALAYDMVRDALSRDTELAGFLSGKAREVHLTTPKSTPADVLHNIEARILRDALNSPEKIHSNYPRSEYTRAVLEAVLDWPANRNAVMQRIEAMLDRATKVDGVTGEKGLTGYSAFTMQGLAEFLSLFGRIEPDLLKTLFARKPALRQTWRFFLDTWCGQQYYPRIGDTGLFARRDPQYAGALFNKSPGASVGIFGFNLASSMFSFFHELYRVTGDPAYVQTLYHANASKVDDLPYDLFVKDREKFQKEVAGVIRRFGTEPKLGSVNKQAWHLAILRAGSGENARALWLDYDAGGYHSHADGMNIGLFAYGLDLLPDFGYPPVQFGGWGAPRATWYGMTAAHNTVVVDGKSQRNQGGSYERGTGFEGAPFGKTTLWADGKTVQAVRASGPEICATRQFERTVGMVETPERGFYVFDLFRVVGGRDHAKFLRSGFGTLTTRGVSLQPAPDYGYQTQMRNFQGDSAPSSGWRADWKLEDRYQYLPPGRELHLQSLDLTTGAQVCTAESWIAPGGYNEGDGDWIPTQMVRRQTASGELASTFVSLLEPYEGKPQVIGARRLPLTTDTGQAYPDACVAVEVSLRDGVRDLILSADTENPLGAQPSLAQNRALRLTEWKVELEGEMGLIRLDKNGRLAHIVLCRATRLKVGEFEIRLRQPVDCIEIGFAKGKPTRLTGRREDIEAMTVKGQ